MGSPNRGAETNRQVLLRAALVLVIATGAGIGTRIIRGRVPADEPQIRSSIHGSTVTQVTVSVESADVRLIRSDDGWQMIEPVEHLANSVKVELLIDAWARDWRSERVAIASPTATEARLLGLMERRSELQFEGLDTLLRVEVGSPSADGLHFVRIGGGRTIYEARVPDLEMITAHVEYWLPENVVIFAPGQLERLTLRSGKNTVVVGFGYQMNSYSVNGTMIPEDLVPSWVGEARTHFVTVTARPATDQEIGDHGGSLGHPVLTVEGTTEHLRHFRMDVGETVPPGGDRPGGTIARIDGAAVTYVLAESTVESFESLLPPGGDAIAPPLGPPLL